MFFTLFKKKRSYQTIEPDEILIDAANLPAFDTNRLEGKIERPLGADTFRIVLFLVTTIVFVFAVQLLYLQIFKHEALAARAEENRLTHSVVMAERGLVLDRFGEPLVENAVSTSTEISSKRHYPLGNAAATLVGYVSYPRQDKNGYWYQDTTVGVSGIEALFDGALRGENGLRLAETDASGRTVSGSIVRAPTAGSDVRLSLDAGLQRALYDALAHRAEESMWRGAAAAIMDIQTGELFAFVSYPSFNPDVMSEGAPEGEVAGYLADSRSPFLDRVVSGLYTPGSVVKPFVAVAALEEDIISPEKQILSTGSLVVPNPYDPENPSVFKDWRAHGLVDMRRALAVSSDVYFYEIGGGFEDQRGLGIARIEKYLRSFGFGSPTGVSFPGEEEGVIPNPTWKAEVFGGERWFLGNTYHTAIGQYGFQVTLLQLLRGTAALANGGVLVTPQIVFGGQSVPEHVPVSDEHLQIIREGMRLAVTDGTAAALKISGVAAAGKTGTAEVGVGKELINSFIIGFFPYDNPRYAFAVAMERAPAGTPLGAPAVMSEALRWIVTNRPDMVDGNH